ncbi:XVIPCD domain-containing protein [Stenotrophomonas sp. PS02289]|uniref:XVIPCD domain-containing protein n=1 Tax=Stenotrophomonas sp. PS02289 TaxID=2991422 RepID=UPI00249C836D|nr:XVIPCD domain-containing protein [Stenotrophomonas sp. PS02289]
MNDPTRKEGASADAAARNAADVAFDPTYTSSNSEIHGKVGRTSVSATPGDGVVKVTQEARQQGAGPAGGPFRATTLGASEIRADGRVQYQLEMETVAGQRLNGGIVESTQTEGLRGRYRVSLPEGDGTDPTRINPFDPQSLPKGSSVTLDAQSFSGTALSGTFRRIAVDHKLTEAEGASFRVDRLDDGRVRVTTGPNSAVEAFNGLGFSVRGITAIAGRQDAMGQSSVRTATFDLAEADGRSAYQQFVANGALDSKTPGMSDVATVVRLGASSQVRLKVELGSVFGVDAAGARNSNDVIQVRRDDGSYTELSKLHFSDNVPITRVAEYGIDGQELRDQRRYELTFDLRQHEQGRQIAGNLNAALTGDTSRLLRSPVREGELNTVSFSEEQLRSMMERTQQMVQDNPMLGPRWQLLVKDGKGALQTDVDDYAGSLARNQGLSEHGMAEHMFRIATADKQAGAQKIDATVDGAHLRDLPPPSPLVPVNDPRQPSSADHPLWLQTQEAVSRLDASLGRQPDQSTDRLSMALLVVAKDKGMCRIDEAVLSDDARYAFAVQGEPHAADRQIARTETAQAVATPVEAHLQALEGVNQRLADSAQAQQQETQVQEQAVSKAMGR